jgi:hypothetical protein
MSQSKKRGPGRPRKERFFVVSDGEWTPPKRGKKKSELYERVFGLAERLRPRQWFDVPAREASHSLIRSWIKELPQISLHVVRDADGRPVATRVYYKVK